MTKEEFDKLIGKVVRIYRPGDTMTVKVIENFHDTGNSKWYYCYDEYTWFMGTRRIAINRRDVKKAEFLPIHEEIVWRIKKIKALTAFGIIEKRCQETNNYYSGYNHSH